MISHPTDPKLTAQEVEDGIEWLERVRWQYSDTAFERAVTELREREM